jgi:hypothetical protein
LPGASSCFNFQTSLGFLITFGFLFYFLLSASGTLRISLRFRLLATLLATAAWIDWFSLISFSP